MPLDDRVEDSLRNEMVLHHAHLAPGTIIVPVPSENRILASAAALDELQVADCAVRRGFTSISVISAPPPVIADAVHAIWPHVPIFYLRHGQVARAPR